MDIKNTNSATIRLHDAECMADGYQATFDGDGVSTVREPVGTALIEKYPTIEAVEDPSPPPDDSAASDDSGGSEDGDGGAGGADDSSGDQTDDTSDTNGSDTQQ